MVETSNRKKKKNIFFDRFESRSTLIEFRPVLGYYFTVDEQKQGPGKAQHQSQKRMFHSMQLIPHHARMRRKVTSGMHNNLC